MFSTLIATALGVIIVFSATVFAVILPGHRLRKKFVNLGTLKGKTLTEIVDACGPFNSTTYRNDGVKVHQWMRVGYHIVLLFDSNGVCLGVASETNV